MFMTPFQHGVVREIAEHGKFDSANPQFQNYPYATNDLNELVAARVIKFEPRTKEYTAAAEWSKVK